MSVLCLDSSPQHPTNNREEHGDFDLPNSLEFSFPASVSQRACPFCSKCFDTFEELQEHVQEELVAANLEEDHEHIEDNVSTTSIAKSASVTTRLQANANTSASPYFHKKRRRLIVDEEEETDDDHEFDNHILAIELTPPPPRATRQAARGSNISSSTTAPPRQSITTNGNSNNRERNQQPVNSTTLTTSTSAPMTPKRARRKNLAERFINLDPNRTEPRPEELGVTRYDIPWQKRKWWQWSPVKNLTYLDEMSPERKEMYVNHSIANDPLSDDECPPVPSRNTSSSRAPLHSKNTNVPLGSQSRSKSKKSSWIPAKGGWSGKRKGFSRRF